MVGQRSYVWGTGRRKTAVARVRICEGEGVMQINKKDWKEYFTTPAQRIAARQPLVLTESESRYDVFVNVKGGGPQGQADAVRHGLARALVKAASNLEPALREARFLTRDARVSERKKYGQRGARARFQFSKR
ncbi:MAG: 30S ribosomal protein S9 [Planctomycetota bacterium]|nr:30S ribosomal protein S9 [Planctomycetota bacterium]